MNDLSPLSLILLRYLFSILMYLGTPSPRSHSTTFSSRSGWALKCIAAGKHVLVEKPSACDAEELRRIQEAAAKKGVIFMDGTMWLQARPPRLLAPIISSLQPLRVHANFSALFPKAGVAQGIRGNTALEPTGALGDMCWCVQTCHFR